MRRISLRNILDFMFGASFVFLVALIWCRLFSHNNILNVILASAISLIICTIIYLFRQKKYKKIEYNKFEQATIKSISNQFLLSTKQEVIKSFYNLLSIKYDVKIKSDFLFVNNNILRPIYSLRFITDKEVLETYKKLKNLSAEKVIIVCKNYTQEAKEISATIKDTKMILLNEVEAYENIFKPLNFVPQKIEQPEKKRFKKLNEYLQIAFNKKLTKNYVLVSVFMIFGSFVLRYNIYYLLFASLTAIFALYSYFNKRFNKQPASVI